MIAIIQARQDSSRLPNKVLLKINKKTIIELIYKRLKKSKYLKDIIFAIPDDKRNKKLEILLKNLKIKYFKGSNLNVLQRYYQTAKKFKVKNIVRITSDCPMIDYIIIDKMIKVYKKKKLDFLTNNSPKSFPHGLDLEIFNYSSLYLAHKNARTLRDKEHVTYFISRNKKKFKFMNYKYNKNLSFLRLTLDYKNDYKRIKKIFNYFKNNIYFTLDNLEKLYKNKPYIFR